jgi:hypothetical protein
MPTEAGVHDFAACRDRKSWMPTCVGMTVGVRRKSQPFRHLVFVVGGWSVSSGGS